MTIYAATPAAARKT